LQPHIPLPLIRAEKGVPAFRVRANRFPACASVRECHPRGDPRSVKVGRRQAAVVESNVRHVIRSIVVFVVVFVLLLIVLGLFGAVVGPGELVLVIVVALVLALGVRSRDRRAA
jgi:hypothetical protein